MIKGERLKVGEKKVNQRTNGPVNAHHIAINLFD